MKPENSTADPETDLFGNPLLPMKNPRGRKAYAKSKANQKLVVDLRGGGMTHGAITIVPGCDEKTLRKYYSRGLHEGAILAWLARSCIFGLLKEQMVYVSCA